MTDDNPYGPAWAELKYTRWERDQLAERATELRTENDRLRAQVAELSKSLLEAVGETVVGSTDLTRDLRAEVERLRRSLHETAGLEEKMCAAGYALRSVDEFDELSTENEHLRAVVERAAQAGCGSY